MFEPAAWPVEPTSPFELRHASTDRPFRVVVPPRRLLMIEGSGSRGDASFMLATDILRHADELLRARLRGDRFTTLPAPILEVAWALPNAWDPDEIVRFLERAEDLRWAQMVEAPRVATDDDVDSAIDGARSEAGRPVPLVRRTTLVEGPAVQLLRIGEAGRLPAIRRLFEVVAEMGLRHRGRLHALLLSDPRRVPPERVRAILRVPVAA